MGVRLSVLRLQNVYGPGQSLTNPYTGVITLFVQQAMAGQPINVYEDGRITRDFVFVQDVVDAIVLCARNPHEVPRAIDIGSGEPISLLDAALIIAEAAGGPVPGVSGRFRLGDVRAAFANIDYAQETLGYNPAWGFRAGVGALIDWIAAAR
jgi:dTDP-L-rhamnose 4-epimerase